jgi:hypothetical protein
MDDLFRQTRDPRVRADRYQRLAWQILQVGKRDFFAVPERQLSAHRRRLSGAGAG